MCFPAAAAPLIGAGGGVLVPTLAVGAGGGLVSTIGAGTLVAGGTAGFGTIGATAAIGGGFGGLGGAFNFLTSPGFSLATQAIGFGVQVIGQQQQAAFQRQRIAFEQATLRNRQIAAAQDIKARQLRLQVEKGIIGARGAQARADLRVEAAGRGVLVDVGSEAAKTEQLAGDVAFAKLIATQEVALKDRQDRIVASGLQTDSALLDFQRAEAERASTFGQIGAGLQLAAGFSKFRFNPGGQLAFRT
jgi:hypothetical protein